MTHDIITIQKKKTRTQSNVNNNEPTVVVIRLNGNRICLFCIHLETVLFNPETNQSLRMQAYYNASIWPRFKPVKWGEIQEYTLIFPPLPEHWKSFDFWETKGTKPMYARGISRNKSGVYILDGR